MDQFNRVLSSFECMISVLNFCRHNLLNLIYIYIYLSSPIVSLKCFLNFFSKSCCLEDLLSVIFSFLVILVLTHYPMRSFHMCIRACRVHGFSSARLLSNRHTHVRKQHSHDARLEKFSLSSFSSRRHIRWQNREESRQELAVSFWSHKV